METQQDPGSELRVQYMRQLIGKIAGHKEEEKKNVMRLEKQIKHLSMLLHILLIIQFALNLGQTSVYADVDKRVVGALSLIASVNTFVLAVFGKLAFNIKKKLVACTARQRRWDKAEDAFAMTLSSSLDDGRLSAEEVEKLNSIYRDVRDVVDGSEVLLTEKKFSLKAKVGNGSGTDHPADPAVV